jgi:hypothetical protein
LASDAEKVEGDIKRQLDVAAGSKQEAKEAQDVSFD